MKKLLALLLALAMAATFASCASNPAPPVEESDSTTEAPDAEEPASDGETTEVNVTFTSQNDQYVALFNQYNSEQSEIFVNFEVLPDQQFGTIANETMGTADGPDLCWGTIRTEMWAMAGMLEPLDAYVERDSFDLTQYYDFAVEQNYIDGQLYGLPKGVDSYSLAINKTVFEKYGVEYPTEGPWTWNDVDALTRELGDAIAAEGGPEYAMALHMTDSPHVLVPIMVGNGAPLFNEDGTIGLNTPEAAETLSIFANLVAEGYAADLATITETKAVNLLAGNLAGIASMASFPSSLGDLHNSGNTDSIILMPWPLGPTSGDNKLVNYVTNNYVMNSGSEVKDAAWEVLKYMSGTEGDALVTSMGAHFPARIENAEVWATSFDTSLDYTILSEQVKNYNVVTLPANQLGWIVQIGTDLRPIFESGMPVEEALTNLETNVNAILQG